MVEFKGISHVSLSVRDRAASATFYREVFGFRPLDEVSGEGWQATVCAHPSGAIVEFQQHEANAGESFAPHRTGLDHLAFRVETRAELDGWLSHLRDLDVQHSPISHQEYGSVLCLRDPDGIQLEIFHREGHP